MFLAWLFEYFTSSLKLLSFDDTTFSCGQLNVFSCHEFVIYKDASGGRVGGGGTGGTCPLDAVINRKPQWFPCDKLA